jgi:hypothetical protein
MRFSPEWGGPSTSPFPKAEGAAAVGGKALGDANHAVN